MNYKTILFAVFGLVLLMNIGFSANIYAVYEAAANCTPPGETTFGPGAGSIQNAIDAANDGDTIIVCKRDPRWPMTATVVVNKSVNVMGNQSGVLLRMTSANDDKHLFLVNASNVEISNFKLIHRNNADPGVASIFVTNADNVGIYGNDFRRSYYGVFINYSTNCIVEDNVARRTVGGGIVYALNHTNSTVLTNNTANDSHDNSIFGFADGNGTDNQFISNMAYETEMGFAVGDSNNTLFQNNLVLETGSGGTVNYGFFLIGTLSGVQLINNVVNDSAATGVNGGFIDNSNSGTTYTNNKAYDTQAGFELNGSNNNVFTNNLAMDTGSGNMVDGFHLRDNATNNVFTGNEVYDVSGDGFDVDDSSSNTFTSNTVIGIGDIGFELFNSSDCSILQNTITNVFDNGIDTEISKRLVIRGNTITNITDDEAIFLDNSDNSEVSSNTILNASDDDGIEMLNSDNMTILSNTLTDIHFDGIDVMISDNVYLSRNSVFNCEDNGYEIGDSNNVTLSGDRSTNSSSTHYEFDNSNGTVSDCVVTQSPPGALDFQSKSNSNVSTGSWLITDYLRIAFSNAVNVNITTMSAADAGAAQTGCNDTENFSKCKLATEGYNVVNVTPNGGGATIDLGVQYDYDKTRRQGYQPEQIVLSEWDVGNAGWASLGWDEFNWMNSYVKVDGITDFSIFGVMTFGDPETVDSGDSGSDKKSLTVEYNVLCPEQKVEVTVEDSDGPVTGVEVKLYKTITLEEKSTDADGMVVFDLTEAGSYELIASGSKYKTKEASFSFDMCEIEVTIPETPPAEEPEEETPPAEEEEVTETSDAMEAATTALSEAESAIEAAKAAGKDTSAAEAKLQEAEQAFHLENFAEAKQLAEEAKALLEAAAPAPVEEETPPVTEEEPVAEPEEEEPAPEQADYSWVLWLVLLVVIVGAGYWYFTKPKGPRKK